MLVGLQGAERKLRLLLLPLSALSALARALSTKRDWERGEPVARREGGAGAGTAHVPRMCACCERCAAARHWQHSGDLPA